MTARCIHGLDGCAKCAKAEYREAVDQWADATPQSDPKATTYGAMLGAHARYVKARRSPQNSPEAVREL